LPRRERGCERGAAQGRAAAGHPARTQIAVADCRECRCPANRTSISGGAREHHCSQRRMDVRHSIGQRRLRSRQRRAQDALCDHLNGHIRIVVDNIAMASARGMVRLGCTLTACAERCLHTNKCNTARISARPNCGIRLHRQYEVRAMDCTRAGEDKIANGANLKRSGGADESRAACNPTDVD